MFVFKKLFLSVFILFMPVKALSQDAIESEAEQEATVASTKPEAEQEATVASTKPEAEQEATVASTKPEAEQEAIAASANPKGFFLDFLTQIEILNSKEPLEKFQEFQKLLPIYFDVKKIQNFVLGKFRKKLSEEERDLFRSVLSEFLILSIVFNKFIVGGEFKILETATLKTGKKYNLYGLKTIYFHPDMDSDVLIQWVIRQIKAEGSYKIIDVQIEGVSYLLSLKSQNQSSIRSHGFEGLIKQLKEKTAQLRVDF